jgi:hypothetical protein
LDYLSRKQVLKKRKLFVFIIFFKIDKKKEISQPYAKIEAKINNRDQLKQIQSN